MAGTGGRAGPAGCWLARQRRYHGQGPAAALRRHGRPGLWCGPGGHLLGAPRRALRVAGHQRGMKTQTMPRRGSPRWCARGSVSGRRAFSTASAFLADGREVKIVTGVDDHSRYCVIARRSCGPRPAGLPGLPRRHGRTREDRVRDGAERGGDDRPVELTRHYLTGFPPLPCLRRLAASGSWSGECSRGRSAGCQVSRR
jgi:hypothetical protein